MTKLKLLYRSFLLLLPSFEKNLLFLVIALLPSQIGKHFWPDFAAIFSLRTDYFSPVIFVWDLLLGLLLVTFVIQRKKINSFALFLLLLFCLTQSFSLFSAFNVGAGLVRLEQLFITGLFGVYIASNSFAGLKERLFWGLFVGVSYSSVLAIFQVFLGKTVGLWFLGERSFDLNTLSIATFDWYGQVFLRAYATFPHPNVLAAYLLVSLSLMFFVKQYSVHFFPGYRFFWGAIFVGSIGLFLTFSRVAVVLYSFLFVALLKKRLQLLVIIFLLVLPFLYVRFHSAFNFDQLSFIRREELAIHALEMFWRSPFFGVGLNNFISVLAYGDIVSGESRFFQPVHMIYLLLLSETGVFGFSGFLFLVIGALYRLWNTMNRKKQSNLSTLVFLWGCFFVMGLFDHYLLTLGQGQRLFFLVWGLSMLEYRRE